jgi:ABC-type dipeptide/oligopeptide/nickel transport system permease subunit
MAVVSLVVLFLICLVAIFAKRVAPYGYDELDLFNITSPPTLKDKHPLRHRPARPRLPQPRHLRPADVALGRLLRRFLSTAIGTTVGALAGYYGGATDNLLMRFTDLILTLPVSRCC